MAKFDSDAFEEFKGYCKQATDKQLENILEAEYKASLNSDTREQDYQAAVCEAERRGWTVLKGERRS